MKMLLGLTQPTRGDIEILGQPLTRASRTALLPSIGSMIEAPPGYGHLTGPENMRIVQDMLDLSTAQVDHALATVRLTEQQDKLVRNYSLGMKQRLGIAISEPIAHDSATGADSILARLRQKRSGRGCRSAGSSTSRP